MFGYRAQMHGSLGSVGRDSSVKVLHIFARNLAPTFEHFNMHLIDERCLYSLEKILLSGSHLETFSNKW